MTSDWQRSLDRAAAAVERDDQNKLDEARKSALHFLRTVAANLDNERLSDTDFRDFMRRSMQGMPGIDYK